MKRTTLVAFALGTLVAVGGLAGTAVAEHGNGHGKHKGYLEVTLQKDRLSCAVGSSLLASDDLCDDLQGEAPTLKFRVPAGTTTVLVEMQWTPSSAAGAHQLALTLPQTVGKDTTQRPEGPSILKAQVGVPAGGLAEEATIVARVGAAHQPMVVTDQPVIVAVSAFVGLPVPAGYSAFA
jgi:uncharacterized membrane protein